MPTTEIATVVQTEQPPMMTADSLIQLAVTSGADVDKLERLIALRNQEMARVAREQYYLALAEFQSDCPVLKKTRPVFNNKQEHMYNFLPLDEIVIQVRESLRAKGFTYTIDVRDRESKPFAVCRIHHKGGHDEETWYPIAPAKAPAMNDVQAWAAGQTYAKRYAFCNAFGILTTDHDDDGKGAAEKEDEDLPITRAQQEEIYALTNEAKMEPAKVLAFAKIEQLSDMRQGPNHKKVFYMLKDRIKDLKAQNGGGQ